MGTHQESNEENKQKIGKERLMEKKGNHQESIQPIL